MEYDFYQDCFSFDEFLQDHFYFHSKRGKDEFFEHTEQMFISDFDKKPEDVEGEMSTNVNSYQLTAQTPEMVGYKLQAANLFVETFTKDGTLIQTKKPRLIVFKKGKSARNCKSDSMRKKFKIEVLSDFIDKINEMGKELNFFQKGERLRKLHKTTTSNINISFNQKMISKTMMQIYLEDISDQRTQDIKRLSTNQNILKKIIYKNCEPIKRMMEKPLFEIINNYFYSQSFYDHLKSVILEKFGTEYYEAYKAYAFDYLTYFSNTKANIRKNKKNKKSQKCSMKAINPKY
jgi:hypothetical protein